MVDIFDIDFDPASPGPGDDDRARALAAIQEQDRSWHVSTSTLSLGEVRWRPHLQDAKLRLLHLELTGEVSHALTRRMRAARASGYELTVALGREHLDIDTLILLQELDTHLIIFGDEERFRRIQLYRSVADWIASEQIVLGPDDFSRLANARLDTALAGLVSVKGRFFEETLCLLFSQVSWLTVDEHGYRNESEEIDLLLGIHAVGHVAELAKGAVAVATAKNESKATSSATVKYLKEQMANRKGRCKLGFLCSATTISRDAKSEILRGSQSLDHVIVQLDVSEIRRMLDDAANLDKRMQMLILQAIAD